MGYDDEPHAVMRPGGNNNRVIEQSASDGARLSDQTTETRDREV